MPEVQITMEERASEEMIRINTIKANKVEKLLELFLKDINKHELYNKCRVITYPFGNEFNKNMYMEKYFFEARLLFMVIFEMIPSEGMTGRIVFPKISEIQVN